MGLSDTPGIWEVTENYVFASRPSTHTKSKPGSELRGAALEQWIQSVRDPGRGGNLGERLMHTCNSGIAGMRGFGVESWRMR